MATHDSKLILKRSTVAGKIPDDATLGLDKLLPGEPAINLTDEILYIKDGANGLLEFFPGEGGIPSFKAANDYLLGDIVYNAGSFYKANKIKAAGAIWVDADWDRLTATAEEGIQVYDTALTYALGDLVQFGDKLYSAKVPIAAPEAWTVSHWFPLGDVSITPFSATGLYGNSDLVTYGGGIFRAKNAVTPGPWDLADWEDLHGKPFTEEVTLADGQLLVQFTNDLTLSSIAINGPNTDNGRLREPTDYAVDLVNKTITLTQSYPAGTTVTLGYLDATAQTVDGVEIFETIAVMQGAKTTNGKIGYLSAAGRAGMFEWSSIDNSAKVTADTQQGIYVAPASDPTGASGAWVRQYEILSSTMFGVMTGTPEGVVVAPIGKMFLRTDGGASTTFYVKESGTSNTGWVAK